MIVQNQKEIEMLRRGGKKLAAILSHLSNLVTPGVTTSYLDRIGDELILKAGAEPVFKGYAGKKDKKPFPCSICVSVNEEIVHGLPGKRVLQKGDIVKIDVGLRWPAKGGLIVDSAVTVVVGKTDAKGEKLVRVTKKVLEKAIKIIKSGIHVGDIGYMVQNFVEKNKFSVVRELVGHGVGRELHEDPEIPNWGTRGTGVELVEGQVVAIEPMVVEGDAKLKTLPDGWTIAAKDKSRTAHFEHTILVTKKGIEVLTEV